MIKQDIEKQPEANLIMLLARACDDTTRHQAEAELIRRESPYLNSRAYKEYCAAREQE